MWKSSTGSRRYVIKNYRILCNHLKEDETLIISGKQWYQDKSILDKMDRQKVKNYAKIDFRDGTIANKKQWEIAVKFLNQNPFITIDDIATLTNPPEFSLTNIIRLAQVFHVRCLSFGTKLYNEILKLDFSKDSQEQLTNLMRMKLEVNKSYFPEIPSNNDQAIPASQQAMFRFPPNLIELTLTNFHYQKDIQLISAINKANLRSLIFILP